jgi:hypothetical protein
LCCWSINLNFSEFESGLISGVLTTLVGFLFAVCWDLWKERRKRRDEIEKGKYLLGQEVSINIQILDANQDLLEQDTKAANENKEVVRPLSLLHTQIWEPTRLADGIKFLDPQLSKELNLTFIRTLILNQRIQGRELYRLTNQSMDNFSGRRALINQELSAESEYLMSRLSKHAKDLGQ